MDVSGQGIYCCAGQTTRLQGGRFAVWPGLAYEFYQDPEMWDDRNRHGGSMVCPVRTSST